MKTQTLIIIIVLAVVGSGVAAVALFLGFFTITSSETTYELNFQEVILGPRELSDQKKSFVIRSEAELRQMWPNATIPNGTVNFDNEMVVGYDAGVKPTGGYSVEIIQVQEKDESIIVFVEDTRPGQGCIVTQALTHPSDIVKIRKSSKPVSFSIQETVRNC